MELLYLIIHIGASGFSNLNVRIVSVEPTKEELYNITRGEGNVLVFKIIDGDFSTGLYEALQNGELLKQIGDWEHTIDFKKVLDSSLEAKKKFVKFWDKYPYDKNLETEEKIEKVRKSLYEN